MPGLHVSLQQELPTKFLQKHQTLEWHSVGVRLRIHVPLQRLDFWQMFSCICNSSTNFLRHAFLLNDKPNKFIIEYFATLCAFEAHIVRHLCANSANFSEQMISNTKEIHNETAFDQSASISCAVRVPLWTYRFVRRDSKKKKTFSREKG